MQHQAGELGISGYIVNRLIHRNLSEKLNQRLKLTDGQTFNIFSFGNHLSGLLYSMPLLSQESYNPEAEYMRIRDIAFSGRYAEASAAARQLVNDYPSYGDARILLGRILAWQKEFDQAAAVIDTLLQTDPNNADALAARRDISLWSKENTPVATT